MSERRRHPRFKALGLSSAFGQVTDISDTGMRVFRKGKLELEPGDEVELAVQSERAQTCVTAQVIRVDKLGLFRHEIGLEFISLDDAQQTSIRSMVHSVSNGYLSPQCWVAA